MALNLVDGLLVLIALLSVWGGVRRGFIIATLQLLTLAMSIVLAFVAYPFMAAWLQQHVPDVGVWAAPASFVVAFVVAHLLLGALASLIGMGFPPGVHRHAINRTLGLFPGAVNGVLNATIVSLIVLTVPISNDINQMARESEIAKTLSQPAEWVEAQLTPIFDPAIRRTLRAITVPPDSHASVPLHFKVEGAKPRPDLEAEMLLLVNAERAKHGLKVLAFDPEMTQVARAHSRDMLARGYFSHITPDGMDLGQRVRKANLRYLAAGENLALAQTLPKAHQGLMNSPGHRANILRPEFGRVGIGVLDGGKFGLMVTQNFRN
ncbi:MAG TPA: CvpA family protein [Ramlibacter sp.]|nr:CvpA family protein [Ramlibacter sp.]